MRFNLLCGIVLCCLSCTLSAQTPPKAIGPDDEVYADTLTHHMSEVSVDAVSVSPSVLSTKPLQEIRRQELEQLGLSTLADALRLFVGTEVRDYGGIGGLKTVSVRSLGAHHTAVSYDGLTLSNTQAGQIDIGRYQLDNVETVSMFVGASDDLLQSARHYASAGVLSIRSERPHFQLNRSYSLRAQMRGGSFGYVAPSLRYWQRLGSRTSLALNGGFMRADGRYPFILKNASTETKEVRENSDVRSWQVEGNLYHTFRDSSTLEVKGCYYDSQRGIPGAVILYNNTSTDRMWERDGFGQVIYEKTFSRHWALRSALKYTHTRSHYDVHSISYHNGVQEDDSRQDETYATATARWTPLKVLSVALAEDVAVNRLHGNVYINTNLDVPNPLRVTSITALTGRLQLRRFQADATLLATYATEHLEAGTEPPTRKRLSPTVALSYRLLSDESLFLRAMFKNTYRLPSFNDTYYRRMGNPNLRPENAYEYNVGVTWSGRPAPWMRYLSLTVDAYYNRVTDKIVAFPAAYVWRMANFGKVNIYGVDVTLGSDVRFARQWSLAVTAAYTAQRALDADSESPTYDKQLPYTPVHHATASAILHTPWLDLGYSANYTSERYSSARNVRTERLVPYTEHNLTASRTLVFRKCSLALSLTVRNLTNAHYEIIQYYPMQGRSVEAMAALTL